MSRNDARATRDQRTTTHAWPTFLAAQRGATTPCQDGAGIEWHSDDEREQQRAAELCHACPLLALCRDYALAAREPYGVWGGTTERQRRQLHRRRARDAA